MKDYGWIAACDAFECEWIALDDAGAPAVFTQLGAARAATLHAREAHGARVRLPRDPDAPTVADRSPATVAVA
jgi:hypothetical protein